MLNCVPDQTVCCLDNKTYKLAYAEVDVVWMHPPFLPSNTDTSMYKAASCRYSHASIQLELDSLQQ